MIKETLDAYASTLNKTWAHDRSLTVGASEIGACARRIFYVKHARAPDDDYNSDWGATLRGTIMEEVLWAPAMAHSFGKKFLYGGTNQKTFVDGYLSATPDGLVIGQKKDALKHLGIPDLGATSFSVECKTSDPRTNLEKPKAQNAYQTQIQLHMFRQQTKHKPNFALLSYTDASFWSEVVEFVIPFRPEVVEIAKARAKEIITSKSAQDFQPEGWIAGGKECKHCPYLKACGIERRNLPFEDQPVDPQFAAEMADMVLELKRRQDAAKQCDASINAQEQAIKDRLREKSIKRIPGVVSWSAVKGRTGYNNKAIQEAAVEAGIDIEQFRTEGEPTDRLTPSKEILSKTE